MSDPGRMLRQSQGQQWRRSAKDRHLDMLRETLAMVLRNGLTHTQRQHAETVLAATTQHQRDQIGRQ